MAQKSPEASPALNNDKELSWDRDLTSADLGSFVTKLMSQKEFDKIDLGI